MKNSEAYLRAAEQFDTGTNRNTGCCDVLSRILGSISKAYDLPELLLFKPIKPNRYSPWWWDRGDREIRVLALCFMAAVAETKETTGRKRK